MSIANADEDKTKSPYFKVFGDSKAVDHLPLISTTADVNIVGVIADVTIKQLYKNSGDQKIEAIYIFPASTRAAVYGMTMQIEDRIIIAEIQEKEEARETYETAKKEGKSASLLEQEKPNVFQMNAANIMPGDSILVELMYTELLVPEGGVYEFVFPTVVGPRYSSETGTESGNIDYYDAGTIQTNKFDININLKTAVPLQNVECRTHQININKLSPYEADISLDSTENIGGNKDFILNYSLKGIKIETGLILSEGKDENFFLLMIQPPMKVERKDILKREYIFIMDVSGSMNGFPLDISKEMMNELLEYLNEDDLFNIIFFAGASYVFSNKSVPATENNIDDALYMINNQRGGGGTELLPALEKALKMPRDEDYSTSMIIISDGYVSVEEEAFDLVKDNLGEANFFSFGIGSSVNRFLIEGLARRGAGRPFVITNRAEAKETANKFREYIKAPVMTGIDIELNGIKTYDVEPKSIPDVFSDRPIIVHGKWKNMNNAEMIIRGVSGSQKLKVNIPVSAFGMKDTSQALKYLWARNKLMELSDYSGLRVNNKEEITDLGLKYNLLTEYTSFVGVDSETRNITGDLSSVNQPAPLPQGISRSMAAPIARSGAYSGGGRGGAYEVCPIHHSYSRQKIYIGFDFGYQNSNLNEIEASKNSLLPEMDKYNCSGNGFYAGMFWEIPFGNVVNSRYGMFITAVYSRMNLNFTMNYDNYELQTNDGFRNSAAMYSNDIDLSYLQFDFLYVWRFVDQISIGIGADFGFLLNSELKESFDLLNLSPELKFSDDAENIFSNNNKTLILKEMDFKEFKSFDFALTFNLQYEILLGTGIDLIPNIAYKIILSKPLENYNNITNLTGGIMTRFAL